MRFKGVDGPGSAQLLSMGLGGFDSGVDGSLGGTRGRRSGWTSSGLGVADDVGRLNSKSSSQFSVESVRTVDGK